MKLFNVDYTQDDDNGSYLTVGKDFDDDKSIMRRELSSKRWEDQSCLYHFDVSEVTKVDGYNIKVEK